MFKNQYMGMERRVLHLFVFTWILHYNMSVSMVNSSLNFVLISFDIVSACDLMQHDLTILKASGLENPLDTLAVLCLVVT